MKYHEVQDKVINVLMTIISGDVTSFYQDGYDDDGEYVPKMKPLSKLTVEQRMCVEDIGKGCYKIHSKFKAADALSKIAGMTSVNHILSSDRENPPQLNFKISFVDKDDK